jgi:DnaJ-class molecular chaperone
MVKEKCPTCKGDGIERLENKSEPVSPWKPNEYEWYLHAVECKTCHGIGWIFNDEPDEDED